MDSIKTYNLINSLQELLYCQPNKIADKALTGIVDFLQPVAANVKISFPDKKTARKSVGDLTHLDLLDEYEKKFANLDVSSAQFVINKDERYIITVLGFGYINDFNGIFSVMIHDSDPLKYVIRQVIELFAGNTALAFTIRSVKTPVELGKFLSEIFPDMKYFGVEGILAFRNLKQKNVYWIDSFGIQKLMPPGQLIEIFQTDFDNLKDEDKDKIKSILPGDRDYNNMVWNEFQIGKVKIKVMFTGKFKKSEIVFSKFRSLISDIEHITGYDDMTRVFKILKEDHKQIVKGERIAAILETAVAVNHEINNPLTAILGNTQLLLLNEDQLSEKVISKISIIEKSAMRIREITQKLMSVVEPITTKYTDSLDMLDIERSAKPEKNELK